MVEVEVEAVVAVEFPLEAVVAVELPPEAVAVVGLPPGAVAVVENSEEVAEAVAEEAETPHPDEVVQYA